MKHAAIYARVSTDKRGERRTVESQLAELRNACRAAGVALANEYIDEGFSGSILVRPGLDQAIGELLVETVSPLALEVALAVQEELQARAEEADGLRWQQVERARYEAELAQRHYLRVDPDNRLVADSLEADWNQKLRALAAAQEEYQRQSETEGSLLDRGARVEILALATDFPRLWRDPATPHRERKRMVRLLLEDVTLLRAQEIIAQVRFRGGATCTLRLPLPRNAWQLRQIDLAVVAEIDRLLEDHTDGQVADVLNARGLRPGVAPRFSPFIVYKVRRKHGLADRFSRLRRQGLLTLQEMAAALGVHPATVKKRQSQGRLASVVYNEKGQRLYVPPGEPRFTPCRSCGMPTPERGVRGQPRKYCSITCRTAAWKAARGWVRPRRQRLGAQSSS